jgi:tetratricopeptide (TPR) repeat protein
MQWPAKGGTAVLPAVIALARRAAQQDPQNPLTWQRLVEAQLLAGRSAEAITSLEEAELHVPRAPELSFVRATTCQLAGNFEAAIDLIDKYLEQVPDDRNAKIRRFDLLVQTDRLEKAEEAAAEIELLAPGHPSLIFLKAEVAWEKGHWADLLRVCDRTLASLPGHTNARFHRALALAMLRRDEEARATLDLDRFVAIRELPVPEGFADSEAFRAALREEILRNPTLTGDPRGKATREGQQTGRLQQPDATAVEVLLAEIRAAVDEFAERIGMEFSSAPGSAAPDAFVSQRPDDVQLVSWAVVYGAKGWQTSHIHPDGWLSGTYYVAAPEAPAGTREGALVLGAIKAQAGITPPWGTRHVEPKPGRLVLFPSWLPHATEATHADELRICVAFDVVPAS